MARPVFADPPLVEALEAARTARFSTDEWDAYITPTPAQQLAIAGMDARALGHLREQLERERRLG